MKNPYKPQSGMRFAQVDHKTMIEVRIDMTDEEAIERYLERKERATNQDQQHKRSPNKRKSK